MNTGLNHNVPWKRLLSEGVVIVASILLAFAIEAWWSELQEREQEREALAAILSDMAQNLTEVERVVNIGDSKGNAHGAFIGSTPEELLTLSENEAEQILFFILTVATFTPYEGSFSTFNLALIRDIDIRNEVGAWQGSASDVVEDTPTLREINQQTVSAAAPTGAMLLYSESTGLFAADPPEGVPEATLVLSRLRQDQNFVNQILSGNMSLNINYEKILELRILTENVIDLLNEYL